MEKPIVDSVLHIAAESQSELIETFIGAGIDIDVRGDFNLTPLHSAVRSNNLKAVQILIQNNANINLGDKNDKTPLHYASLLGYTDITQELLQCKDVDVNKVDIDGDSAIHKAVKKNFSEIVSLLIKAGVDISVKNKEGHTPKDIAKERKITDLDTLLACQDKESV